MCAYGVIQAKKTTLFLSNQYSHTKSTKSTLQSPLVVAKLFSEDTLTPFVLTISWTLHAISNSFQVLTISWTLYSNFNLCVVIQSLSVCQPKQTYHPSQIEYY